MTEEEIKREVQEILDETELLLVPVEIIKIANYYGFSVFEFDMEDEVSGMILVNDNTIEKYGTNKIIVVNSNHSSTRKRFTVAHELAHYIIQGKPRKCYAHRDSGVYNSEEREANSFASALLMPEDDLRSFIDSYEVHYGNKPTALNAVKLVMMRYNVSQSAAQVRLIKLGII